MCFNYAARVIIHRTARARNKGSFRGRYRAHHIQIFIRHEIGKEKKIIKQKETHGDIHYGRLRLII